MKILRVVNNDRRRVFEIETRRGTLVLPYSKVDPSPSPEDRVVKVFPDQELDREWFTYVLESGTEESVPLDAALEYNRDPNYTADMLLFRLTAQANQTFKSSGLSVREVARRMSTSPAQVYRLLDTTNYSKSWRQLVALLTVLDCDVEVAVRQRGVGG